MKSQEEPPSKEEKPRSSSTTRLPRLVFIEEKPEQPKKPKFVVPESYQPPMEHIKRARRPSSRNSSPDLEASELTLVSVPSVVPRPLRLASSPPRFLFEPQTSVTPPSSGDERRLCLVCGTTDSPQWRRGPAGSKSLCNACGLHYQAMMRREREIEPVDVPRAIPIEFLLNPPSPPDKPTG